MLPSLVTLRLDLKAQVLALGLAVLALILGYVAVLAPPVAVAGAFAIAFVMVSLSNLTVGVCLFAFVSFLEVLPGLGELSATKLAGLVVALSWIAAVAAQQDREKQLISRHPGISIVAVLFLAWTATSVTWAEDSGEALYSTMRFTLNICLLPIVFAGIRTRRHALWYAGLFIAGTLLSSFYGTVIAPGDSDAAAEGRLSGAGVDPNYLATSLVASIALTLAFASGRSFSGLARGLALAAGAFCSLALVLTVSRTGLAALAAAAIAGVAFAGPGRRVAIASVAVLLAGFVVMYFAALAPQGARDRVLEVTGGTGRTDIWAVGWRMVEDEPLHGIGAANFPVASIHYLLDRPGALVRDDFIVDHPKVAHNIYLETLAELGIVGLVLLVALLAVVLSCGVRAAWEFRRRDDGSMELLARAWFVATLGVLAGAFFNSLQYTKPLWLLIAFGPCLLAVAQREKDLA